MLCTACGTENLENGTTCVQCGSGLSSLNDALTLVPDSPSPGAVDATLAQMATLLSAEETPSGSRPSGVPDFGSRYRVERMLGEGGMGSVYLAFDIELSRKVALKLIRPELANAPTVTQRFKQELLLASKISHKNILRIHDLSVVGELRFISMAYVEGEDLHACIRREGRLPLERALSIARQLCGALEAAHSEGVVHRDLKPQNILLDKNDQVLVSDFGLAKSLETDSGMTVSGEFLGTPRYMAPEQVDGAGADHRVDLYAFGLILYEMLTGDVPFHAGTAMQLMYKHIHEMPVAPSIKNPDIPEPLVRLILKCLEKRPDERYQTANEILRDLESGQGPAVAKSVNFTVPGMAFSVSRGKLVAAGLLAMVLVAGGVFAWRSRGAQTQTAKAPVALQHVAVLPFRVLGDQEALDYIATGVSEAVSAKLAQLNSVQLASATTQDGIDPQGPLDQVARLLGVNLVVRGTVQGNAERFRAVLTLDNAQTGAREWSEEFSGVPADLLTLEDQIYSRLVSAMRLNPGNEEMARGSAHPTEDIDAYDLYLRGRNAMRGQLKMENVRSAISMFEQATQKDARFALAYTGIADASLRMYLENKDPSWATKAVAAAEQSRALGESLPEAHFALGSIYTATGKTAEGIAELKRALELVPNSDDGFKRLGDAYRAAGRKDEALAAYAKAVEVNPYFWMNENALGVAYMNFGENEKALQSFRRVTQLDPNNAAAFRNLGMANFRMGKTEEGIADTQKALQIEPHPMAYSNIGTAYFYMKRYAEAVSMFEKAVEMSPASEVNAGNLADAYRWSGRQQDADATYDKAIALALKALRVNPRDTSTLAGLALYYAKKGSGAQASQFIRRARAISPDDGELAYIAGVVNALGGQVPQAVAALREAFEKGYPAEEAENDPELGKLRELPEFTQLITPFRGAR